MSNQKNQIHKENIDRTVRQQENSSRRLQYPTFNNRKNHQTEIQQRSSGQEQHYRPNEPNRHVEYPTQKQQNTHSEAHMDHSQG